MGRCVNCAIECGETYMCPKCDGAETEAIREAERARFAAWLRTRGPNGELVFGGLSHVFGASAIGVIDALADAIEAGEV